MYTRKLRPTGYQHDAEHEAAYRLAAAHRRHLRRLALLRVFDIYAHHRSPQPTRAALAADRERLAALCDEAAALCGTLHRAFLRVAE